MLCAQWWFGGNIYYSYFYQAEEGSDMCARPCTCLVCLRSFSAFQRWRFNPKTQAFTYVAGTTGVDMNGVYGTKGAPSAANFPGARESYGAVMDAADNYWLFGGKGASLRARSAAGHRRDALSGFHDTHQSRLMQATGPAEQAKT